MTFSMKENNIWTTVNKGTLHHDHNEATVLLISYANGTPSCQIMLTEARRGYHNHYYCCCCIQGQWKNSLLKWTDKGFTWKKVLWVCNNNSVFTGKQLYFLYKRKLVKHQKEIRITWKAQKKLKCARDEKKRLTYHNGYPRFAFCFGFVVFETEASWN